MKQIKFTLGDIPYGPLDGMHFDRCIMIGGEAYKYGKEELAFVSMLEQICSL